MKSIAIIGLGPRGTSVLERVAENVRASDGEPVTVHVFDDTVPGAGAVWHPRQSPHLLMNTVTSQVSLFTDESVPCEGPIVPGPSMYEWLTEGHAASVLSAEPHLHAEAVRLGPDDYPSRALYGVYLTWVFSRIRDTLPDRMRLIVHNRRVTAIDPVLQGWSLTDSAGATDHADHVVLALGHLPSKPDLHCQELSRFAAAHNLTYVPPANPADVDISDIPQGEPVILRGLGLCFFDYLGLLTTGRGGRFRRNGDRLVYEPSGREPLIHAGCRRGVPHHARGSNQKGVSERHEPRFLTSSVIDRLQRSALLGRPADFMREVWPLISAEVEFAYYSALLTKRGTPLSVGDERDLLAALTTPTVEKRLYLRRIEIAEHEQWDWAGLLQPCRNARARSHSDFTEWLTNYLNADAANARGGNLDNPLKAAVDALRDLRNEVRQVVDHGVVAAHSYRDHVAAWYTPMNAFLSIGPPVERVEELLALIEAGIVTIAGPDFAVDPDLSGSFSAYSPLIVDSRRSAKVLIEARLPENRAWTTADPLVEHLLDAGIAREHVLSQDHMQHRTGSIDITGRPYQVIDRAGRAQPGMYAFGLPTEGVHWATAAGVRPGVGSVILNDADSIARSCLELDVVHRTDNDSQQPAPEAGVPQHIATA